MVVGTVKVYFLILALGLTAWAPERPNIILSVADDLGYGDVSAFGAQDIRTSHIDSLASDGMKLTSFYSAPLCTPSRAQMVLGQAIPCGRAWCACSIPKARTASTNPR